VAGRDKLGPIGINLKKRDGKNLEGEGGPVGAGEEGKGGGDAAAFGE
jgi:hypothetical protein